MNVLQAAVLGLIQGFAEFLPVSSSGHLALARFCFPGMPPPSLDFDVFLHFCTTGAIVVVFRKELRNLVAAGASFLRRNGARTAAPEDRRAALLLALSAIPVGVVGLLFKSKIEALENRPRVVAGLLLVTGVWLGACAFVARRRAAAVASGRSTWRALGVFEAVTIGCAQAVAILPGISRSGATIGAGLLLGVDRERLGAFAFLMSIAPILGAAALQLFGDHVGESATPALSLVVGGATAFLSGFVALRLLLPFVRRGRLEWFALYCVVAAAAAWTRL